MTIKKETRKESADKIRAEMAEVSDDDLILFAAVAFADDFGTVKGYIEKIVNKHIELMPF